MTDLHDDIFKALADGSRRQILAALCHSPAVAGELARLVGLAPNAVSFHLKWLRSAGLVSVRRTGRNLWYQVEPDALAGWRSEVNRLYGRVSEQSSRSPTLERRPSPTSATPPPEPEPEVIDSDQLPSELL